MIGREGELRDQKVPRPLLVTAVDSGVKIDEMPTRIAGRLQWDFDIALAVESAGVPDIAVVIDDSVNISCLGPAYTLQMHGEGSAGRAALDIEPKRGGLDPKASRLLLAAVLDGKRVPAAEVIGNDKIEADRAR